MVTGAAAVVVGGTAVVGTLDDDEDGCEAVVGAAVVPGGLVVLLPAQAVNATPQQAAKSAISPARAFICPTRYEPRPARCATVLPSVLSIWAGRYGEPSGVAQEMFGRHRNDELPQNTEADVDVHLEWDIDAVQQAVTAFLQNASDGSRQSLVAVLGRLDSQIDLSDAYAANIVGSPLWGQAPKGDVLGETSSTPMAEEIPGAVVRVQVALVRAAKAAVRDPSPGAASKTCAPQTAALAAASGRPDQP